MAIALPTVKWTHNQSDVEAITSLRDTINSAIEGEVTQPRRDTYDVLRKGLISNSEYSDVVPEFVRNYRSLGALSDWLRDAEMQPNLSVERFVVLSFEPAMRRAATLEGSESEPLSTMPAELRAMPGLDENASSEISPIDSSSWTGVPKPAVLEGERLAKLQMELTSIERQVEALDRGSNSEKQQAMAIITAIKVLAEAPEPPEKVIKDLISLAGNLAGVGALFLSLVQMFLQG
ncbi:hypothetical protein KRZ98_10120 [Sphingobium sp. AS12]|uniref:hypothetical protein n=1 Tax=Sphingobium sp. AS12 TaxID=2849495 RepID=UPI001C31DE4A|nr:hypothetical protein [Sphingobium sp. AS12]MBV2148641.1 hypothetical protein [Sphingobium sp. AS12]